MSDRLALVILDGWGLGLRPEVDAIHCADTPFFDHLMESYPDARLTTFGRQVGLPEGQMGNSEVGHLNIGAGRVVYQELARINKAIAEGSLQNKEALRDAIDYSNKNHKPIHLIGLVSDGGVHSHIDHLKALCRILADDGIEEAYVHAILDGRDTDPKSGLGFIEDLQQTLSNTGYRLASIIGRYYAMDRDLRWDRTKKAYDLFVKGIGEQSDDPIAALKRSYEQSITDEFVLPINLEKDGTIEDGDVVLFFNFRTDRPRQLVRVLTQEHFKEFEMSPLDLHFVTMTNYNQTFEKVHVIYEKDELQDTLGAIIAENGLTQIRIAETEKYPHVTFFFNGGRENHYEGEDRILIPSPKVATYDLKPEMSAYEVTEAICERIKSDPVNFICINYANADMVGHTGDFEAAKEACSTVDRCLKKLVTLALEKDYKLLIIADHGNSDIMINEDGTPHTAHTTNLVPIIFVGSQAENATLSNGKLADIAPTILSLMGIDIPEVMTGKNLLTFNNR